MLREAFLLVLLVALTAAMRKQGVAVKGKLLCGTTPAVGTTVRITDLDTGPDPDDTLDEKEVNPDGTFSLTGTTRELTPIDPVLYIWHSCRDEKNPCQRKLTFTIPKKFIHNGEPTAEQWVDIGVLNLEGAFDDEQRECLTKKTPKL